MKFQCPGAGTIRQPSPEFIRCQNCGREVEIWTDEIKTTCAKCNKTIMRQAGQSCLDWCRFARECVGEEKYNKYKKNKEETHKKSK
ncbi:MAG: phosphohydrolase [Candidatus Omnitrophica bacterium]|nr:phosphohydrolase [Candidatus Omnitrophota bacterium]